MPLWGESNTRGVVPGTVLTSMIKRGDVAVFDTIRDVGNGAFKPGLRSFGLIDEGVSYVSDGPHAEAIPAAVKQRVAELARRVAAGEIQVPAK